MRALVMVKAGVWLVRAGGRLNEGWETCGLECRETECGVGGLCSDGDSCWVRLLGVLALELSLCLIF